MVGTITFLERGIRRVATLADDHSWSVAPPGGAWSADRDLLGVLGGISAGYDGPADGPFGPGQLAEAGAYLAATDRPVVAVHLAPQAPAPPGVRY